jgi:phosphotriesterase-related protein
MSKTVMTVTGPVPVEQLGPTLMHEHVFCDLTCNFVYPQEAQRRSYLRRPITMDMLGLLRRYPFSLTLENVVLDDEGLAIDELGLYHRAGGLTVVDCTVLGIGQDASALQRVARATGLNIVQGTGIYIEPSHPDWVVDADMDELEELFVRDVTRGIEGTDVQAGLIGEIGTSGITKTRRDFKKVGDITTEEEKVLRAAGRASVKTGLAVSVHLDPRGQGAIPILDILEEEGVDAGRVIMGHIDGYPDIDYHLEVAARGAILAYDGFGREYYLDHVNFAFGHDVRRVEMVTQLVDAGYEDQLVVSQDVCMKMDLRAYGGNGYDHILVSVSRMLRAAGVTDEQIAKFLTITPQRLLTIDAEPASVPGVTGALASDRLPKRETSA